MSTKEWAQLVCTTDIDAPDVPIRRDEFTIGRAQNCDFSLPGNKLISGQHCKLARHADGTTVLTDTSTNGTFINSSQRVSKGKDHELQHGDEIFLVFRKDDMSKNVAYMFQDLSQLLEETLLQESESECTQEYEFQKGESENRPSDTVLKRPVSRVDSDGDAVPAKRHCDEQSHEMIYDAVCRPVQGTRDSAATAMAASYAVCITGSTDDQHTSDSPAPTTTDSTTTDRISANSKTKTGTVADAPTAAGGVPETTVPSGIGTATYILAPAAAAGIGAAADVLAVDIPGGLHAAGGVAKSDDAPSHDAIADTLLCSICQDIFHDCVSLQPCLHSFCAACYTSWMDLSKECPTCRNHVKRISRNFIINSLVEAFVKEHPDRKRSEVETAEMDAKNKITRDMMTLSKQGQDNVIEIGSDDDEEDMSDEDGNYSDDSPASIGNRVQNIFGFGAGIQLPVYQRPPDPTCQQCPGHGRTASGVGSGIPGACTTANSSQPCTSTAANQGSTCTSAASQVKLPDGALADPSQPPPSGDAETSTSSSAGSGCHGYRYKTIPGDSIRMPNAPRYECLPGANHLMCSCCRRHMPDRRQDYFANPRAVPSQKCDICGNFFCHLYWGCDKYDCFGCLNKFQDLYVGKKCLDNLILKNVYESDILKSYLQRNDLTWKDVLGSCMTKLDSGEYSCQDGVIHRISSVNTVCYHCGLKNFQELAYQYRKDIPRDQLPVHVLARPDCHWGNKCRTQVCKLNHATNFNHICDQTRF